MSKKIIFLTIVVITIISCSDKFELNKDDLLFTEGFIIPLAQAELSSEDIFSLALDNQYVYQTIGPNGEVILSLQDTIVALGLNDLVSIGAMSDSADVEFNLFNFQREYTNTFEVPFASSMSEINKAEISYTLKFSAKGFSEPMNLILNIPSINSSEGGKEFDVVLNGNQEIEYKLNHEEILPEDSKIKINVIAKPSRQTGVYEDYTGKLFTEISDVTVHSVSGVFKDTIVNVDSGDFKFDIADIQKVSLETPHFYYIIKNSFPVKGMFDLNLYGISPKGDKLKLVSPDIAFSGGEGAFSQDTLELTEENSNFSQVFEITPDLFTYSGNIQIKALDSSEIEISEYDSISVGYKMDFPSTLKFNTEIESEMIMISESDFIQDLEMATLTLETQNTFPLQTEIIMYLYDANDSFIDSVNFPVIEAASNPSEENTTTTQKVYSERELTESELDNLKLARELKMKVLLGTNDETVVIKAQDSYILKMALKAKK